MTDSSGDPAHLIPANARLRRGRTLWRMLFFLALGVAVLALVGRFAAPQAGGSDHIARVVVDGTITTNPARLEVFEDLGDDPHVKAVVVAINSPGGTTAGGEELYEAITALRAKKPVVAVVAELGASAAYMTAIAADRIFARRLSIVGSIGVLYQHVDAGKLLDTIGVDLDKVQTGPLKAEPDINEPMQGEVRAALQGLVDDSFVWFVDIVAERRGLSREQALAQADGRILTGRQALDVKLIDAFGGEPEALAWLSSDRQIAPDLPVATAFPLAEQGWLGVARWFGRSAGEALGSSAQGALGGAIALDGLVSLWQAPR